MLRFMFLMLVIVCGGCMQLQSQHFPKREAGLVPITAQLRHQDRGLYANSTLDDIDTRDAYYPKADEVIESRWHSSRKQNWKLMTFHKETVDRVSPDKSEKIKQDKKDVRNREPTEFFYRVAPGESLSIIAQKVYGRASKWVGIAGDNSISDPDQLAPGTSLRLVVDSDRSKDFAVQYVQSNVLRNSTSYNNR